MPNKRVFAVKRKSLKSKLKKNKISIPSNVIKTNNVAAKIGENFEINNIPSCSSLTQNATKTKNQNISDNISESDSETFIESTINEDDSESNKVPSRDQNLETQNFLATWAIRHNTSHVALNELLLFLKNNNLASVPMDARTLLKTPKFKNIIKVEPGEYVHIGLQSGLEIFLTQKNLSPTKIFLTFHIDGVPLSKSSSSCFWPILCKTNVFKRIIVIGVYHGYNQPKDFNVFLRPFVDELKQLMHFYSFNGKIIRILVRAFILDTPARSHVLGTKSHAGYSGCCRCIQEGEYLGRITFQEMGAEKRTNASFRNQSDENYHNRRTILEELEIDLVDQFVLDYLHLVLLGVVKKQLKMWTSGRIESLLPSKYILHINNLITSVMTTQPFDFQRRIQTLSQLHNYKGTEFRAFLLYVGPFVLRNVLPKSKYNHFMLLHTAISFLCKPEGSKELIDLARSMLREFVEQMKNLYGSHHLVFNVHCLLHLADDVEKFGHLDSISSFEFESFMGTTLKKHLRKKHQPLSQIFNRIAEINSIDLKDDYENMDYPLLKKKIKNLNDPSVACYGELVLEKFRLNDSERDCWFLTRNNIILKFHHAVRKSDNEIFVLASEVKRKTDFFDYPIKSSNLKIFKTNMVEASPQYWNIEIIESKLFCMNNASLFNSFEEDSDEDEDYYASEHNYRVFFPLIHTSNL